MQNVAWGYEQDGEDYSYEKGRQEQMKRFGDTAAGRMNPQDLYPPRKWVKASDILEQPFVLVRANTGKATNGNDCAYLTLNFQRIPARVTDHEGKPLNKYDEYSISHQGQKVIGRVAHLTKEDFSDGPIGPVCFVAVSTPGSQSKSHDLWDYEELEELRQRELAEDNPFMEETPFEPESEPEPDPEPEQSRQPKSKLDPRLYDRDKRHDR